MSQEGNSDLSTKFSTLNVNAMEFVPSFCSNVPPTAVSTDSAAAATSAEVPAVETTRSETPISRNTSPTKTDEEQPTPVAVPTELFDDKSPDNPGS